MIFKIDDAKYNKVLNLLLENEINFEFFEDLNVDIHGLWLEHVIESEREKGLFTQGDMYDVLLSDIPFLIESVTEEITYNDEVSELFAKMYDYYKKILIEHLESSLSVED